VRVPSFSPAATTFPLPIYHTTTTMSGEALRPWNLNVNYLPPPLIISSPPSSPKNVKNKVASVASWAITLVQSAPLPNHHHHLQWYSINLDVSSLTTESPPAMLNLQDNYSSSDEAYIKPAGSITAGHSARRHKKTLNKPIQNLTDLPKLPTFDPLQPVVPPHKGWN